MIKNNDIICISSIDWDFIWQGHQEIMSSFAANGNRVLFIENTGVRSPGIRDISRLGKRFRDYFKGVKGIRKESENLFIYSPLVLPFPYSRLARWVNKHILLSVIGRWMKAVRFSDPIIWTFLPTGTAQDIIENINKRLVVYYCIDSFAASSASAKKIKSYEKDLISSADLVFVTSKALYDHCAQYSRNVHLFPFGVNIENFEKVRVKPTSPPAEFGDIKGPVAGYVGGIHKWIDQDLVRAAAQRYPGTAFVFVGPVQTDISSLSSVPNIRFLGARKHSELPHLVKYFSVSLIPYLITDYTANVYPTKLNEYLSMGKPVVSTALPEVIRFNRENGDIANVASGKEEFISLIERSIGEHSDEAVARRIAAARENSWASRIEKMSGVITDALERRRSENGMVWKEELIAFYRKARRKATALFLTALAAYLLVFYTPLIWYAAEPLKISEQPVKADAIIVFAGGAGESGKQGQGYEERVEYAVELYKRGYAGHLIFSSGYTYTIKEVDIMKALAVSMGVPASAITLENKSGYTYEFVRNTGEIMDRNGWKSALLVSSPYHMSRASLVYKKSGSGLKITCTPIPDSMFYRHRIGASARQVNGIIHEYASIVYYWWKGYI